MFKFLRDLFGIHTHDFDQWEESQRGNKLFFGKVTGQVLVQKRRCQTCGFVEWNKQEWESF